MKKKDNLKKNSQGLGRKKVGQISKEEARELGREVCHRIRICRKNLNMSQQELAKELEMSASYLSEIEKGAAKANPALFIQLMTLYNVNIDYLFNGNLPIFLDEPETAAPIEGPFGYNKIDSMEKLIWVMNQSTFARHSILALATRFAMENEDLLKKSLEDPEE